MGEALITAGQRITASMLNGLPVALANLATGSVTSTTTETVVGTLAAAIPAGDAAVNSGYEIRVSGTADGAATSPTLTLALRLDTAAGAVLVTHSAVTYLAAGGTGRGFFIAATFHATAVGVSGKLFGVSQLLENVSKTGNANVDSQNNQNNTTIDTTVAHNIVLTAKWSAASASNTARTLAGDIVRI